MKSNRKLLVEGADDQHVILALLERHAIPEVFEIEEKRGFETVLKTFPVQLKGSGIEGVGIVVDADADLASRWQAVRSALLKLDYSTCPDTPSSEGIVLKEPGKPRFGAWIMPDNNVSGMLEDFVACLVPSKDKLWPRSCKAVASIPAADRVFSAAHNCKAQIHTWLAWQETPGTPMGLAITKRYLDGEAKNVRPFLSWVDRLFVQP